jgi:hypothetical protein
MALLAWRSELQAEADRVRSESERLTERLREVTHQLGLLDQLLGVGPSPLSNGRSDLIDAAADVLRSAGGPLHISVLRRRLQDAGVSIPGKGLDANVIVHLRRRPDVFRRVGRGTYALVETGMTTEASTWSEPGKQKRRGRKARRRP